MADDIPADWYPDAQGTIRWWDGQRWTEHVRDSSQAAQGISATAKRVTANDDTGRTAVISNTTVNPGVHAAAGSAASTATAVTPGAATSTSYFPPLEVPSKSHDEDDQEDAAHAANRRVWLTATAVGLAAFFLGMGIGGREKQEAPAAEPTAAVSTASADLDQRQQDLDQQQKQLDEREKALDDREQALNDRDATEPSFTPSPTSPPTPTPSPTATGSGATTMGEGTYKVGEDVQAGTYRTAGPIDTDYDCEYTVSNDEAGDDVVDDEQTGSSATVTLTDGEYFTTDYCEDWTRQ